MDRRACLPQIIGAEFSVVVLILASFFKGSCARAKERDARIACNEDGNFYPLQCRETDNDEVYRCWCVNATTGSVIPNTQQEIRDRSQVPDCNDIGKICCKSKEEKLLFTILTQFLGDVSTVPTLALHTTFAVGTGSLTLPTVASVSAKMGNRHSVGAYLKNFANGLTQQ